MHPFLILILIIKAFCRTKKKFCEGVQHRTEGTQVWAEFEERGAEVTSGQIVYTLNGSQKWEEWFISPARVEGNKLVGLIPPTTTHYLFNFIDENNFLVSYSEIPDKLSGGSRKGNIPYSRNAFNAN